MATDRLVILDGGRERDRRATMVRDVRAGLSRAPRTLPPKYFYDEVGTRLFDAICDLPEYYLTRAERALLERHAGTVARHTGARVLVEIGSGTARKTGLLLRAMADVGATVLYVPFDIAPEAIAASARSLLGALPALSIRGVVGDFACDLERLAVAAPPGEGPRLFAFLGSTVGNLDEQEAPALLRAVARLMTPRDSFLLGVDLVKDARVLVAAYDDARGVTAAFNRNVLRVLSRELDGDWDEQAFDHRAVWEPALERIEMHLVARRPQRVHVRAADLVVEFDAGDGIRTEISRKFTRASVERTLREGDMRLESWLADERGDFALALAAKR